MDRSLVIFAGLVLLSFSTAALAGFGGIVIAVTLGAHFLSIEWLVPRLVALNILLMSYLVIRHRAHADWRQLRRRILPLMLAGLAAGFALSSMISGRPLQIVFGVFIVLVSGRELATSAGWLRPHDGPMPAPLQAVWMLSSGAIQGIYASGGPLLVYALSRSELPKATFRSTLAVVWLTLNSTLLVGFVANGRFDATCLRDALLIVPVVVLATAIGEWGHHRIDEQRFRVVIHALLFAAGAALLF